MDAGAHLAAYLHPFREERAPDLADIWQPLGSAACELLSIRSFYIGGRVTDSVHLDSVHFLHLSHQTFYAWELIYVISISGLYSLLQKLM